MRQKLFIFLGLFLVIALLIGINAVSYVQKDKEPDNELTPNRSTYNSGATGTRAFYDLLSETGRKVTRWQEKPFALLNNSSNSPQTFVIIGQPRLDFEKTEIEYLLKWVSAGGRLVIIDRDPPAELIKTTAHRIISIIPSKEVVAYNVDPANQAQMTNGTAAAKPLQPTVFTRNINAVQPSRFASSITINLSNEKVSAGPGANPPPTPALTPKPVYGRGDEPPPVKSPNGSGSGIGQYPKATSESGSKAGDYSLTPPFAHLAANDKNILVDFPYGSGRIVYLTDPYIVSNAGISTVDNAQLGLNIVASQDGLIAFDEYHQGYGISSPLIDYFEGTPAIAIFLQFLLLLGIILFTQSRRFARPLPAVEPNRLSKLEYVSAIAQLQESTRAYDLAVENIYTQFRRSVTRLFGVDNYTASRRELAALIAERANLNRDDLETLMRQCEEIIQGEPTNKREIVQLTSRLREIEGKLNLKRKRKEAFKK